VRREKTPKPSTSESEFLIRCALAKVNSYHELQSRQIKQIAIKQLTKRLLLGFQSATPSEWSSQMSEPQQIGALKCRSPTITAEDILVPVSLDYITV
jgi:hypothetical protein